MTRARKKKTKQKNPTKSLGSQNFFKKKKFDHKETIYGLMVGHSSRCPNWVGTGMDKNEEIFFKKIKHGNWLFANDFFFLLLSVSSFFFTFTSRPASSLFFVFFAGCCFFFSFLTRFIYGTAPSHGLDRRHHLALADRVPQFGGRDTAPSVGRHSALR